VDSTAWTVTILYEQTVSLLAQDVSDVAETLGSKHVARLRVIDHLGGLVATSATY
jgi:hypothetical protein